MPPGRPGGVISNLQSRFDLAATATAATTTSAATAAGILHGVAVARIVVVHVTRAGVTGTLSLSPTPGFLGGVRTTATPFRRHAMWIQEKERVGAAGSHRGHGQERK